MNYIKSFNLISKELGLVPSLYWIKGMITCPDFRHEYRKYPNNEWFGYAWNVLERGNKCRCYFYEASSVASYVYDTARQPSMFDDDDCRIYQEELI